MTRLGQARFPGLVLLQLQPEPAATALAWIFVAGRAMHSAVQILTGSIRLRGVVFTINFLAVLGLWVIVVIAAAASPVTRRGAEAG